MQNRLEILRHLNPANQRRFLRYCRWLQFCEYFYLVPPVGFGLRAAVLILVLLVVMPFHPMAIPTAIGGGISFALLLQGGKFYGTRSN
jgi:hypothetical protein